MPYWQYKQQRARAAEGRRTLPQSFHYGSGARYRPRTVDRRTFRYRLPEFRKRRFPRLQTLSHRGRSAGHRQGYAPGIRYDRRIRPPQQRPSTIRYGFQRARR
jgi:hypothetical protein